MPELLGEEDFQRDAGIQPAIVLPVDVRQARKVQTHLGNDVDALRMGFESRERKGRQQQSSDFFHNSVHDWFDVKRGIKFRAISAYFFRAALFHFPPDRERK